MLCRNTKLNSQVRKTRLVVNVDCICLKLKLSSQSLDDIINIEWQRSPAMTISCSLYNALEDALAKGIIFHTIICGLMVY